MKSMQSFDRKDHFHSGYFEDREGNVDNTLLFSVSSLFQNTFQLHGLNGDEWEDNLE
jgi:hypothetical protein